MARGRLFCREISESKKIGSLNPLEWAIYSFPYPWSDIEGRMDGDTVSIMRALGRFGINNRITMEQVEETRRKLHEIGLWIVYGKEGEEVIQVVDFHRFNYTVRGDEIDSRLPAPADYDDDAERERWGRKTERKKGRAPRGGPPAPTTQPQGDPEVTPGSAQGHPRVTPGSAQGQPRVTPGSAQGQPGVSPGSPQGHPGPDPRKTDPHPGQEGEGEGEGEVESEGEGEGTPHSTSRVDPRAENSTRQQLAEILVKPPDHPDIDQLTALVNRLPKGQAALDEILARKDIHPGAEKARYPYLHAAIERRNHELVDVGLDAANRRKEAGVQGPGDPYPDVTGIGSGVTSGEEQAVDVLANIERRAAGDG